MEMDEFNDKHKHDRQVYEVHIHIHSDIRESEILDAINHWHEAEIEEVMVKLRKVLKDIKSTPAQ